MAVTRGWKSVISPFRRTLVIRYLLIAMTANLCWEIAQLPLYSIWKTASKAYLVYAVVHCTAGDAIILSLSLLLALFLAGDTAWPKKGYFRVAIVATFFGVSYTIFSEWINSEVLQNWAYAPAMPLFPVLGTGLSPLLQWIIIPPAVLMGVRRGSERPTVLRERLKSGGRT